MEINLLDRMLETYLHEQTPVTVVLQNKIRVTGKIRAFDSYVIVMDDQKREILYRHAVSCISPLFHEEQKRQPAVTRPAPTPTASARPPRVASQKPSHKPSNKPRPTQPQAVSASAGDPGLSNSMKDGLLKWMQEQKAAK
jgi:RNA chaperone Hfq